jgi:uncharacterized protein DUF6152
VTVKRTLLVLLAAAVAAGVPLYAHHSFASYYFEDQSTTITGDLVQFDFRSPHAWVHVNAADKSGQVRRYSAEWANPNRLGREGITKDTLRPGDRVVLLGSPGRDPDEYKLHLKGIERPADGWAWRGNRGRR